MRGARQLLQRLPRRRGSGRVHEAPFLRHVPRGNVSAADRIDADFCGRAGRRRPIRVVRKVRRCGDAKIPLESRRDPLHNANHSHLQEWRDGRHGRMVARPHEPPRRSGGRAGGRRDVGDRGKRGARRQTGHPAHSCIRQARPPSAASDHRRAHGAMITVGEVDNARNGFDPTAMLTDWDTGTVSTLARRAHAADLRGRRPRTRRSRSRRASCSRPGPTTAACPARRCAPPKATGCGSSSGTTARTRIRCISTASMRRAWTAFRAPA